MRLGRNPKTGQFGYQLYTQTHKDTPEVLYNAG